MGEEEEEGRVKGIEVREAIVNGGGRRGGGGGGSLIRNHCNTFRSSSFSSKFFILIPVYMFVFLYLVVDL